MPYQSIKPGYIDTTGSANGQVLVSNGSVTYWANNAGGGGGGASVTVSDTPPAGPSDGNLWWNSNTGIAFIYYNDGSSSQWVELSPKSVSSSSSSGSASSDEIIAFNLLLGLL